MVGHITKLLLSQAYLLPNSQLFPTSVDFGYILGRDPKPFPPPVKVCKEMVDGMGGTNSIHYHRFRSLCFTAFTSLRKSANLILNLVALMVDANIPDIKVEPDKAVLKVSVHSYRKSYLQVLPCYANSSFFFGFVIRFKRNSDLI